MTHTKGPWESKPETDYVPAQIWADGRQLAEIYGESRDTRAANARLIASAPDLFAALQAIVAAWDSPLEKRALSYTHLETAKFALAKAKGR